MAPNKREAPFTPTKKRQPSLVSFSPPSKKLKQREIKQEDALTQEEMDARFAAQLAASEAGTSVEEHHRRIQADEDMARRLDQEWRQAAQGKSGSYHPGPWTAFRSIPSKATSKVVDLAAMDASIQAIPLADDILHFDPYSVDTFTWPTLKDSPTTPYALLTHAFVLISATRSRLAITTTLTNLLRIIRAHDPDGLLPSVYLISNHIAPAYDGVELGLGGAIVNRAIKQVTGKSSRLIKSLWDKTGDPGDVAYEAKKDVKALVKPSPITVQKLFSTLHTIARMSGQGSAAQKLGHVTKLLVASRGEETRFLVRTFHSHLRIQAVRTTIATALARVFALIEKEGPKKEYTGLKDKERAALLLVSPEERQGVIANPTKAKDRADPRRIAIMQKLARAEKLVREGRARHPNFGVIVPALLSVGLPCLSEHVPLRIGTPISPMLGSITRSLTAMHEKLGQRAFVSEFKYDGQRCQIHAIHVPRFAGAEARKSVLDTVSGGKWVGKNGEVYVRLFSRHLEEMTVKYPDITDMVPMLMGQETEDEGSWKSNRFDAAVKEEYKVQEVADVDAGEAEVGKVTSFIMDAEVVAMGLKGELLPFQTLANRSRKDVNLHDIKVKVGVFAFDLMYLDGESLLKSSFRTRRNLLHFKFKSLSPKSPLIARFAHVRSSEETDPDQVAKFFEAAQEYKCEGIMVKSLDHHWESAPSKAKDDEEVTGKDDGEGEEEGRLEQLGDVMEDDLAVNAEEDEEDGEQDTVGKGVNGRGKALLSTYEPDKRCESWLKVKKDYIDGIGDSLDLVPIGAWHGMGRKATWWSPILLALYDPETGVFQAVCKCISGFSDAFYKDLNVRYTEGSETCMAARYGASPPGGYEYDTGNLIPDVWWKPSEVWELRGADVTISPKYTAAMGLVEDGGLSIRFPRFIKKREDKSIEQASTPTELADIYRQQMRNVNNIARPESQSHTVKGDRSLSILGLSLITPKQTKQDALFPGPLCHQIITAWTQAFEAMTEQNQETARLQERLKPTSRTNPRPPSPIRSLSQNPLGSRATSTATTAVNATGSSVFFSSDDRTAKASLEVDASPLGRFKPQHQQSLSAGPRSHTKVVMLTVSQPNMPPPVRRSTSHRPPCTSSDAPAGPSRSPEGNDKEKQRIKAAAKLAEKENWEKTRGAGSAVMDLLKSPEEQDSDSSDTSGERSARPQIRKGDSSDSSTSSHSKRRDRRQEWEATQVLPSLEEVQVRRYEPTIVTSADKLLSRGISEYTLLPRILGRGKFSSVFLASKPSGPNGAPQLFAVKHTPLFPHHPLIATRLLREPTLLAELPPHPNLVTVHETIRTPGHFYLVEEYLGGYVTLEALLPMRSERSPPQPPCLPTDVAKCILDQLLSAVHAIHHPLQICHRDIKPENILVHPDTLELKLLDFGLATHFSKSEPKLTTCCGSPAFHCPEIVTALRNPQGAVRYWGPEVDVWTCGITMLRVLTGIRYPIGASHSNVRSMSIRAQRAVGTIPDPELRERVGKLLQVNGERRMRNFEELVETIERQHTETQRGRKEFKSTTFIPTRPQHTMHLPLVVGPAAEAALSGTRSRRSTSASSKPTSPAPPTLTMESPSPSLILSNPLSQPPQRVLSFIKYCLRCAGILYHCWPDSYLPSSSPSTPGPWEAQLTDMHAMALSGMTDSIPPPSLSPTTTLPDRSPSDPYYHIQILECVLEIIDESDASDGTPPSLVQTLMNAFSFGKRPPNRRSLSTPPKPEPLAAERPASGSGGPSGQVTCLTFYMVIRFPKKAGRPGSSSLAGDVAHSRSRASSRAALERDVSIESFPRQPIIDSNSTTPRASRTSNPSIATKELTIETSPDMLGPTVSASAPASRATSRTRNRKESRARAMSNTFRKSIGNRVLVHITDERALEAVKKALSVGGTTVDPEEGPKEESTKRPGLKHRPLSYGGETKQQSVESRGRQQRAEWMALQAILPISSGSNDDAEYISRGRPLGISKARGKSQLSSVQEPQLQLSSDPQTLANKIMEMYNKDRQALTVQLDAINFEAFKILFPDFEQALMILAELTSARETYMSIDLVLPSITCGHELVMIIKMLRVVVPRITTKTPGNFTSVFEVLPCIISRVGQGDGERVFEACCMLVKRVVEWTTRTKETVEHFLKAVMAAAEFVTPRLYSAFLPGSILELKGEGSWKLVETTLSELGITLSSSDPLSFAVHVYIEAFSTRSIGAGMEMAQLAMQQQLALAADEKLSQTEPYLATPSFTALLWGLQEEKVKDVVAVCSAHAPICPDPQGRKARLDILKYLLRTRTEETVAPLKEVVKSSPFSQMQATALGLLRSVFDHVPLQVWEEVLDVKGGEDLKVEQCSLLILLLAKKGEVKRAEQFIEQLKEEEGILALQVERVREAIERKR